MRMKLLKIVVILLLSGSGDARPQKSEGSSQPTGANTEKWKPVQATGTLQNPREDSRYTWNSGNRRIPYINYYHDTMAHLTERSAEVSVDEPMRTNPDSNKYLTASRSSGNRDSRDSFEPLENSGRFDDKTTVGKLSGDNGPRISKSSNDRAARNEDLTKLKSPFLQHQSIPASSSDSVNPPPRKSTQKFASRGKRDRRPNSRISCSRKPPSRTSSTVASRDSRDVEASRRTGEICLNNSRSTGPALGHDSSAEFSDRKAEFSTGPVEVESSTEFDHVAAIKRITGTFSRESAPSFEPPSPVHANTSDDQSTVPLLRGPNSSNRHWSSKHSNGTKSRQPSKGQPSPSKKGQTKVTPSKILFSKNNASVQNVRLKNWPNGAIQNADDFHNYEKYTSFGDDSKLEPAVNEPVPPKNVSLSRPAPVASPGLQEIVHWLKVPAFMTNGSHIVESGQPGDPVSLVFDPVYQNLEPNRPSKPGDAQTFKPGFIYPVHSRPSYPTGNFKVPSWLGSVLLKNKTVYNPQTQVSQNTVVQLINADPRKPNRTTAVTKVPGNPGPSGSSSGPTSYPPSVLLSQLSPSTTSKPGPNVHIGFTSYEDKNKVPDPEPQTPLVTYDQSCPTILINSYTRINNTIQSKEGCTDLNIIINSHVFNTNMFKPTPPPVGAQLNPDSYPTYGDKYVGVSQDEFLDPGYQSVPIYQSSSSGSSEWPQGGYYSPPKDPHGDVPLENDVPSDVSNVEVFQGTQISLSGSNLPNDASAGVEASPPVDSSLTEVDETDSPGNSAGTDSQEASSAAAGASGQASDDPGLNSLVESPVAPSTGPPSASPSPSAGLAAGSSSPAPSANDDDDDDDLSPVGIIESIASVFTYFTFVNPLHYGFFSLAAAPFTALAAGVLGIITFLFPWVFPSPFNLGRANDYAAVSYWPNLEEIARRSMDKYGRLNEWKSRRKKRKR